ncbi:hypothetical protein BDN72DRAFT_761661 [Pluteus cervinus]|uniref:Uncharacterized protein n=1 Tax=Pluteus cervinus TaxID=181527 RepID=A0ACD3B654_9AGAR|nr:hypothetical protein BDN72DRAFT_761661 [Pluteus cervinus]
MAFALRSIIALGGLHFALSNPIQTPKDPCAVIGGQTWVSPKDVRACYTSVRLDPIIKANILEVITKTLAFHASLNYQIQAPPPYNDDVQEDLMTDLARINATDYALEYDFHLALSRATKRLNDGHAVWVNACYVSMFVNFIPLPLNLLPDDRGNQDVHIAHEAFEVVSAEFPDQIDFWQDALPGNFRGQLESLSGAKVLAINGRPPFDEVNANAAISGGYQALGTRQNAFFSSYRRLSEGWTYLLGDFAQKSLPLDDQVELTVIRVNRTSPETITVPYRSRIGPTATPFNDTASWRSGNCVAKPGTNGRNIYAPGEPPPETSSVESFEQQPAIGQASKMHAVHVMLHDTPLSTVLLPEHLQPTLTPLPGSYGAAQFHMLDNKTGIIVLGSLSDKSYDNFMSGLYHGLLSLKSAGGTQLLIDVTNNGGGFVCATSYLHRIIAGPKSTTEPQALLDKRIRVGPLAKELGRVFSAGGDPAMLMLFNPLRLSGADSQPLKNGTNWLDPSFDVIVNGRPDSFSQVLSKECPLGNYPYPFPPPDEALFDTKKVVIIGNGKCASACSLFLVTMGKHEGVRNVVVGGKKDVKQQYCGAVGGQASHFTAKLKNHPLAPPDLLVDGVQGIVWRLGIGIDNPGEPEEWQDHLADLNLPLTRELVNNPLAIWKEVTRRMLN